MNAELSKASDRAYREKSRGRKLIQDQIDSAAKRFSDMQNYTDGLEENKQINSKELKEALKDKRAAIRSTRKAKALAAQRLKKWHNEQARSRELTDKLAEQQEIANETSAIVKKFKGMVASSEENKQKMKKEWTNEAATRKQGKSRHWPVWVVLLICELLVNGTPPATIPANIQTMYETLYGEPTNDLPSVSFVRSCRTIIEVMGKMITAIKLANAPNWKQLWTDTTTR